MKILLAFLTLSIFTHYCNADVSKDQLIKSCSAEVTKSIGSPSNVLYKDIQRYCETINLIPKSDFEDDFANWLISTYKSMIIQNHIASMKINEVKHRLSISTKAAELICPKIIHDQQFYKDQSSKLLAISTAYRHNIFNQVKVKIKNSRTINVDFAGKFPSDAFSRIAEVIAPSIYNPNVTDFKTIYYGHNVSSKMLMMAIIRQIYFYQAKGLIHSHRIYKRNLFELVLAINHDVNVNHKLYVYSSVKPMIDEFLGHTLSLHGGELTINWLQLSSLLDGYELIMWGDKDLLRYKDDRVSRRIQIKTTKLTLLDQDESTILEMMLRPDVTKDEVMGELF